MIDGLRTTEEKLGQLDVTGSVTAVGGVEDGNGNIHSISTFSGTALAFGPKIQIGSAITTSVGFGSAIFNSEFADTNYYFNAVAGSSSTFLAVNAGSVVMMVSGAAGRNVSGVTFKGAASAPYTWIAIGL